MARNEGAGEKQEEQRERKERRIQENRDKMRGWLERRHERRSAERTERIRKDE